MSLARKYTKHYSFEEYLKLEEASKIRNEFHDGIIIPVEATTKNHNTIVTNFLLNANIPQLRKNGCRLYHENVITKVDAPKKKGVYPDIVVTCNEEDRKDVLVVKHPILIVEVLSNSTAKYDKTGKFFKYQRIPSLKQYILISQYACAVEFYKKMENGQWVYSALSQLADILSIPCIDAQIPLSELYVDINFEDL